MKKAKFTNRYKDDPAEVQEYMGYIADALIEKHGDIPDQFIISLDLLAKNLSIMVQACLDMKEKGITDDDRYHGKKKSAPLQTYFQAQGYVNSILSNFGLTPSSKAKIKQSQNEVNIQEFIDNLTA